MIHLFELFFFLLIIFHFIRTTFYEVFLWQLKEYRFDRFCSFLSTSQGKKYFLNPIGILKLVILFLLLRSHLSKGETLTYMFVVFTLYFFEFITVLVKKKNILKFPNFTIKALLICILSIFFLIFSFIILRLNKIFLLLILDRILSFYIALAVLLVNFPFAIVKKILSLKALRKITHLNNLTVIGITGSYGKTSTKEFLATILSEKFKVAKTPASNNTDIGIAKYIINELKPDHEVFVVEMGAYKKGEIKAICSMVHPKIGIITGINEQHVELFGSLDNTKKAKYELIESLPANSTAIFNGGSKHCLEMAEWARERKLNVLVYWPTKEVRNVKTYKDHLEFDYLADNKRYALKAGLLGRQNIENILAAIYAARNLRMSMMEIKRGVVKITSPDKTMKLYKTPSGLALIDDSFNANPDGVLSALEYMKLYRGKKILVLTPLIELGEESAKIHQKLGKASSVCDLILLTNQNFETVFREGAREEVNDSQKVQVVKTSEAIDIIKNTDGKEGVVVFEGKEAGKILERVWKVLSSSRPRP